MSNNVGDDNIQNNREGNFIYFLQSTWSQRDMAWKGCTSPSSSSLLSPASVYSPPPYCAVSPCASTLSNDSTQSANAPTSTSPSITRGSVHLKLNDALSQEASAMATEARTKHLCAYYKSLDKPDKVLFLKTLARDYNIQQQQVLNFTKNLEASFERGDSVAAMATERLRQSLVPRYHKLFSQIGRLDGGVKFLVDLRSDILEILLSRSANQDDPHLKAMNNALRDLLMMWFSVGFLSLNRITWQNSSCEMLQKISEYEAVHPIRNWTDLRRRVGPYRRCFVFEHHSMPREPIVILHTALTDDISDSMQSIVQRSRTALSEDQTDLAHTKQEGSEDVNKINTAIFYSITSTQKGLQGIEMGNYLIKKVVRELIAEFPRMQQFSSLSPIPGFKAWVLSELHKHQQAREIGEFPEKELLMESEVSELCEVLSCSPKLLPDLLKKHLTNNSWSGMERLSKALKSPLMRLCARYLYSEKRRGFALNPVANFHLRNGAVMWRLNWLADQTPRGLGASCGLMVNYRYYLDQTESNSRNYLERGVIEAPDQFKRLLANSVDSADSSPQNSTDSDASAS